MARRENQLIGKASSRGTCSIFSVLPAQVLNKFPHLCNDIRVDEIQENEGVIP